MNLSLAQLEHIKQKIILLAKQHGFQDARVSTPSSAEYFERFLRWVDKGYHGQMSFLERNQSLREKPEELHPGTVSIVSLRYDYLPENAGFAASLKSSERANISRYALGKDYHKLLRKKLNKLCQQLQQELNLDNSFDFRVFVDSAPVLETAFAEKSGLGWKGKHSLIINKDAGSWFFLGEIFINLPLAEDKPAEDLCANCSACIRLCPTQAIIDSKTVDARRCISYLTIENKGEIPLELRPKLGNRIYGCDDCQLACPWNRFASTSQDSSFFAKNKLDKATLLELWSWDEATFLNRLQGSPIRRIGYQSWLRNLAVAIGNSGSGDEIVPLLEQKKTIANEMVNQHIDWAILQLRNGVNQSPSEQTKKLINCVEKMLPRDA